jgi:hypothetical protein
VAAMYFNCQRQTGTGGRRFTWVILTFPSCSRCEGKLGPTSYVCVFTYVWAWAYKLRMCAYLRMVVSSYSTANSTS